jgi:AcrR family transcriptional regulator
MEVQSLGVREQQKEKRKKEIMFAGLTLFTRRGYSATKIKDIADQVGMSVGLLFHYFESKEKLYEELIQQGIKFPMDLSGLDSQNPLMYFQNMVDQIFHLLTVDPSTANMFVLMSQAQYNEATPPKVQELLKSFDVFTPSIEQMKKGQQMGIIREGDPYALVIAFLCAIQGIAEQIAMTPNAPCPQSDWIMDIIKKR